LPVSSNLSKNLTSLANLSPTPKSLLTGHMTGDISRPHSGSSRSSCEYQSPHYGKPEDYPDQNFPRRGNFNASSATPGPPQYRVPGYTTANPQTSPMYCNNPAGYQYSYNQPNGSSAAYPAPRSGAMQGPEQYPGYPSGYPAYPGYDQSSGQMQHPSGFSGYQGNYSKQSNFSEYNSMGYSDKNYYYNNCQSSEPSQNSNTPLPPDFSYVGNSPADSNYSDFYAMG